MSVIIFYKFSVEIKYLYFPFNKKFKLTVN